MKTPMLIVDPLKLRALRLKRDWTQRYLASLAGVSHRTVTRLEAEDGKEPKDDVRLVTVNRLSRALNVPPWSLLKDVPDP